MYKSVCTRLYIMIFDCLFSASYKLLFEYSIYLEIGSLNYYSILTNFYIII